MKVLTVDDSKTIRAVVAHSLAPLGLTVLQAADGEEGLEVMRSAKPDLLLLDVNMPTMDGMALLAQKARDPQIAHIPVVMLTAGADQDFVLRCLKLGAKGYIVKPFEKKTLVSKVSKLLQIEAPAVAATGAVGRGPVILALDQDEKELSNLMEILLDGGELLTALDPKHALKLVIEQHPESVWVDATLPPDVLRAFVKDARAQGVGSLVALVPRGAPPPPVLRELGIRTHLPKPFIRLEVREFSAQHFGIFQRFLSREGASCVLQIPGEASVRSRDWVPALKAEVKVGLERAATEGVSRLILDFSKITGAADVQLVAGVVAAASLAASLNIPTLLAVPDEDTLRSFSNYQDLKGIHCTRSVQDALVTAAGPSGEPPASGQRAA